MDLLIVGDERDEFSRSLVQVAQSQGYQAEIWDLRAAAQLFTIAIGKGKATVAPDVPMVLRLPAPSTIRSSFDESFQDGESLATLWAASTLMQSPVINRPTAKSFWGQASYSGTITCQRARISAKSAELFALYPPFPPKSPENPIEQQWYVQNTATQEVDRWSSDLQAIGPYRGKWSNPQPAYEIVTVLGDKAWRSTAVSLEHLELENQSLQIARHLELTLATFWWDISEDLQECSFVKVNPFPMMSEIQFIWSDLSLALMEVLFP